MNFVEQDPLAIWSNPPGPRTPAFVQTALWLSNPAGYLDACREKYGPVFYVDVLGWGRVVMIGRSDMTRQIFADSDNMSAGRANDIIKPVVGSKSIFCLDGPPHKMARKVVMPSLTLAEISALAQPLHRFVGRAVTDFLSSRSFSTYSLWRRYTMEMMLMVLGGSINLLNALETIKLLTPLIGSLSATMAFVPSLQSRFMGPLSPIVWFEKRLGKLDSRLADLIEAASLSEGSSLIRSMVEKGGDEQFVRDQTVTVLIAGTDTTATVASWATYWLYSTPGLVYDIRKAIGTLPTDPGKRFAVTMENSLLNSVCIEALRLVPVADFQPRVVRGEVVPGKGPLIVSPCNYLIHRDPDSYHNSRSFDPRRFIDKGPPKSLYFPFGGGSRHCPGSVLATVMIKTLLVELAFRVDAEVSKRAPRPLRKNVILGPKEPFIVSARERASI